MSTYAPGNPSITDADFAVSFGWMRNNLDAAAKGDTSFFTSSSNEVIPITSSGTTTTAGIAIKAGSGTTSSRKAQITFESLETVAQKWLAGLNGTSDFVIRDATAAVDRVTINTSGAVGIGAAPTVGGRVQVFNDTSSEGSVGLFDTRALAASVGGTITLGGKYNSGGSYTAWATIKSYKTNATDGDFSGGLKLGVRNTTASYFDVLTLDSAGNAVVGSAALATNATDGFPYLPSCAGTPTGSPTSYTGRVPIVVDTTNSKIWFRIGGTWKGVVVA